MDYNKDIEKLFKESPTFSSSKEVDKLYDMFLRMLQEIAVLKEKLYALEIGLKEKGIDSDELLNEINKHESHVQELIKHHKEMISRVISNIK